MAAAVIAALSLSLGVVLPASDARAADATCAEAVLDDWSDGRIDGIYDRDCYLGAIAILPEDVRAYTSAADDIARALQSRGTARTSAGPVQQQDLSAAGDAEVATTQSSRGVPTPLVLLAAIAISVLAAGSAGLVARRVRVRRGA